MLDTKLSNYYRYLVTIAQNIRVFFNSILKLLRPSTTEILLLAIRIYLWIAIWGFYCLFDALIIHACSHVLNLCSSVASCQDCVLNKASCGLL